MASFNIHIAVGSLYQKNNKIKNKLDFFNGIVEPDMVEDKTLTHFSGEIIENSIIRSLECKVNLVEFLDNYNISSDYNKGWFLHLVTDYLFYNYFLDKDYLKSVTHKEFSRDIYHSYDDVNDYLINKYQLVYPSAEVEHYINKNRDSLTNGEHKNILPFEKLDEFILKVAKINLENYVLKIKKSGCNVVPDEWEENKMEEKLLKLKEELNNDLNGALTEADVLNVKSEYVGKKSEIQNLLSGLKDMSVEDKKKYGSLINNTKKEMEELVNKKLESLQNKVNANFDDTLDYDVKTGSLHPVTIIAKEVTDVLKRMGFTVVSGPEMESEYYNFEALNVPKDHPARDMQDTYYLDNGMLLRTQTSDNQIHAMENYGAPLRICAPGRTFRNEDLDANHENTFFQIEGMVIDKGVSIENLLYVMKSVLSEVFKRDVDVRLRPGFFPFTEPSYEMDMSCLICGGKGCPTCKNSGYIEMVGSGMVHPNVLKAGGIDSEEYTGFAFGIGLTRLAMMKYKINDIRVLNSGDIRYLENFKIN